MKKLIAFFRSHIKLARGIVLGFAALEGCCMFPLRSEIVPFSWLRFYLMIACYGAVAEALAGIYGPGKERWIYLKMVAATGAGLVCRYLLEFGEVSNTYNFTLENVTAYLFLVPLLTVAACRVICERRKAGL